MENRNKIMLIGIGILAILVSGCIGNNTCKVPADCEGKPCIECMECEGYWKCVGGGKCMWYCKHWDEPEDSPRDELLKLLAMPSEKDYNASYETSGGTAGLGAGSSERVYVQKGIVVHYVYGAESVSGATSWRYKEEKEYFHDKGWVTCMTKETKKQHLFIKIIRFKSNNIDSLVIIMIRY